MTLWGENFLKPDGDGSSLTGIDATQISSVFEVISGTTDSITTLTWTRVTNLVHESGGAYWDAVNQEFTGLPLGNYELLTDYTGPAASTINDQLQSRLYVNGVSGATIATGTRFDQHIRKFTVGSSSDKFQPYFWMNLPTGTVFTRMRLTQLIGA